MKSLQLILSTIILASCSCEQTNLKKYDFSEIGMTINVSTEFSLQDSFLRPQYLDSNQKQITDTQAIKELTAKMLKSLLIIESPDHSNSMSINILPITKESIQRFGDSAQYLKFSKIMLETSARQLSQKFDTLFTTVIIDRVPINKLFTISKVGNTTYYSGMYYTKIKDFFLVIKIDYKDEQSGNKFKSIIEAAKFD